MSAVTIKRHDTAILFTDTLVKNGAPLNLTNCSVKFLLKKKSTVFSATATVVNALTGQVSYGPNVNLPDALGTYNQEWEVTFNDATVLTFPSSTYNTVTILEDLNDT